MNDKDSKLISEAYKKVNEAKEELEDWDAPGWDHEAEDFEYDYGREAEADQKEYDRLMSEIEQAVLDIQKLKEQGVLNISDDVLETMKNGGIDAVKSWWRHR